MRPASLRSAAAIVSLISLLAACANEPIRAKDGSQQTRSFSVAQLAKSDIDDVTELHQRAMLASLRALATKFYKRNPREFRKAGHADADAAVETLFRPLEGWAESSRKDADWAARLADAWRPDYVGDRVGALFEGLLTMGMASYGNRREFYLTSRIDAQTLYNSARNLEAVAWKIANARDEAGSLYLLSNAMDAGAAPNLSFEREFGKLIATQDNLARIVEDKTNRTIRAGTVSLASMLFLPVK